MQYINLFFPLLKRISWEVFSNLTIEKNVFFLTCKYVSIQIVKNRVELYHILFHTAA